MVVFMAKEKMQKKKKEKTPPPKYNMWQNSWFMIKLAWTSKEKKVIFLSLLSAIFSVALNLVDLYVSPTILSAVERHVSVSELILTILAFVIGLMFFSAASSYVGANTLYGRATVRSEVISLVSNKSLTTSYPNIGDKKFDNLLTKSHDCTNSNNKAAEAIWQTLTRLTTNILGFVIYVSIIMTVQPLLIIVILVTSVTSYFVNNYINGYRYRHRDEEAEYQKHLYYLLECRRDFQCAKDIRIFGLSPWLKEMYAKAMIAYKAFEKKVQGVYIWARIVDLVLTFFRNGIAYAYLISLIIGNNLGVADFLLYFTAVGGFASWVTGILSGLNTLYRQSLDISNVRECIEYKEPFKFEDGEPIRPEADRKYEIRLENVSFRYPGADKDTLSNINLTLHPGEKLAIVGLNGAGKTTLVKLICGFLDPDKGRVLLDGRDIRDYNRTDYYTMFSAVFQSFSLIPESIAVNVAQNDTDIDMERVKDCIDKAGLRGKVESLPDSYNTYLNREVYEEATMLSGGETQRLMLARALYKNAPFLILDEPTAALDPIAESEMYQKYNEMANGKSSVYISHRLASTRFCDRIIMIDNAGIVEEGTHEELLKLGGKYAELFEVQSKYYKEGVEGNEKK